LDAARTVFLYGRPGIGKTFAAYNFGRVNDGFYAITLTEDTSAAELRGHYLFKGGDAIWHDGPFVRAMKEGKRLVINEITNASADVLALLFPILESIQTAELTLPNGETIRPAPGFHVVATDNQPLDRLPEALRDRFTCCCRLVEPHPDALAGLPDHLRRAAEKSFKLEDDRRISARGWSTVQMLEPELGLLDACRVAFGPDRGRMVFDAIVLANG
jgi:MoxR-like ATPase